MLTGNIWILQKQMNPVPDVVVPVNGDINKHGFAVMGRGLALDASRFYPNLGREVAKWISTYGNTLAYHHTYRLYTFPVKEHWRDRASLDLITRSCRDLADSVKYRRELTRGQKILIPHVGCGNGKLDWKDVKPILESYLDPEFFVVVENA